MLQKDSLPLTTRTLLSNTAARLYKFNNLGSSHFPSVFVAHSDDLSKLWHERFEHLNYFSLQQLYKENMVTGLLMVSCKNCACFGCVLGKNHRNNFDKHASTPLEFVHSDLFGHLPSTFFSGFKYFLSFIMLNFHMLS